MERIRRNPRAAVAVTVLAVLCVVVLVWGVTGGSRVPTSEHTPGTPALASPTATPSGMLKGLPTPSSSTDVPHAGPGATAGSGTMDLPGLQGESMFKNIPRHRINLHVTSDGPIGTVGYYIPTSVDKFSGVAKDVQHVWDLATIVYGNPDYARIWLQAGARGYPITCTITVDGRVTENRTTDGPYAQLLCQG